MAPSDAAEACRMLVGGEIASETFDVDAFLPLAATAMGSLIEMNSPMAHETGGKRPASRAAQDWYARVPPPRALALTRARASREVFYVHRTALCPRRSVCSARRFDPELDSSLSPILTPSLRHQLRALMASKSPTPHAAAAVAKTGATSHQGSPLAASAILAAASTDTPCAPPNAQGPSSPMPPSAAAPAQSAGRVRSSRKSARGASDADASASAVARPSTAKTPVSGGRKFLGAALQAASSAVSSTVSSTVTSLTNALSAAGTGAVAAASPSAPSPAKA